MLLPALANCKTEFSTENAAQAAFYQAKPSNGVGLGEKKNHALEKLDASLRGRGGEGGGEKKKRS